MRRMAWLILGVLLSTAFVFAQEGHPLTGTWTGDWEAGDLPSHITLVMNWEGDDRLTGVINPGPDSVPIQSVFVDFTKWIVRIEAVGKDATGNTVRIEAEGVFEDLGSPHRKLVGKWTQGDVSGEFKVTRE